MSPTITAIVQVNQDLQGKGFLSDQPSEASAPATMTEHCLEQGLVPRALSQGMLLYTANDFFPRSGQISYPEANPTEL